MDEQSVEIVEIGEFHVHRRRQRRGRRAAHGGQHGVGGERGFAGQQPAERVFHPILAVVLRGLEDPQIVFDRWQFAVFPAQLVVGLAKRQRGIQVLDVTVIAKRARLADQRVDHVPIIEQHLARAKLSRQTLDALPGVP